MEGSFGNKHEDGAMKERDFSHVCMYRAKQLLRPDFYNMTTITTKEILENIYYSGEPERYLGEIIDSMKKLDNIEGDVKSLFMLYLFYKNIDSYEDIATKDNGTGKKDMLVKIIMDLIETSECDYLKNMIKNKINNKATQQDRFTLYQSGVNSIEQLQFLSDTSSDIQQTDELFKNIGFYTEIYREFLFSIPWFTNKKHSALEKLIISFLITRKSDTHVEYLQNTSMSPFYFYMLYKQNLPLAVAAVGGINYYEAEFAAECQKVGVMIDEVLKETWDYKDEIVGEVRIKEMMYELFARFEQVKDRQKMQEVVKNFNGNMIGFQVYIKACRQTGEKVDFDNLDKFKIISFSKNELHSDDENILSQLYNIYESNYPNKAIRDGLFLEMAQRVEEGANIVIFSFNEEIVSFMLTEVDESNRIYIGSLNVNPAAKQSRIGTHISEFICDNMYKDQCLWARVDPNLSALNMYLEQGFIISQTRMFTVGESEYEMFVIEKDPKIELEYLDTMEIDSQFELLGIVKSMKGGGCVVSKIFKKEDGKLDIEISTMKSTI